MSLAIAAVLYREGRVRWLSQRHISRATPRPGTGAWPAREVRRDYWEINRSLDPESDMYIEQQQQQQQNKKARVWVGEGNLSGAALGIVLRCSPRAACCCADS